MWARTDRIACMRACAHGLNACASVSTSSGMHHVVYRSHLCVHRNQTRPKSSLVTNRATMASYWRHLVRRTYDQWADAMATRYQASVGRELRKSVSALSDGDHRRHTPNRFGLRYDDLYDPLMDLVWPFGFQACLNHTCRSQDVGEALRYQQKGPC